MPHQGDEEGYGPTINIFLNFGEKKKREGKPNALSEELKRMHAEKMAKLEEIRAKTAGSSHQGGA